MPQTSVTAVPAKTIEGMLDGDVHDVVSGIVDQTGGIRPGRACLRTANGSFAAALPSGAGSLTTNVLGVSLHSQKALINPSSSDNEVYEDDDQIPLLRHGRVWVKSEEAVTPASPVFVRVASGGGGTQIGAFRASADTATAVAWTAAKFLTTTTVANDFVLLEVNM